MLVGSLIAISVLVAAFVVVVAMQPATFRVARSVLVSASPAAAFEQVNDLRAWEAWSPWAKIDPNYVKTYEGPATGTGATFAWAGNSKVGAGRMTITESRPDEFIRFALEFLRPFRANHIAEFVFEPRGGQTLVTWTMNGDKNFISKAFGLFCDMDKMIGRDFEKGLAQMKALTELTANV